MRSPITALAVPPTRAFIGANAAITEWIRRMSVGGMVNNRKFFGSSMLPGVDHLAHTLDIEHNAFSRGLPQWGPTSPNELERLIALHDASTIAAVIVEPIAGSAGVLLPPSAT